MAKSSTLQNFSAAVKEALNEIMDMTYEQIDKGLDKAMDYMIDKLAAATPEGTGLTKESWKGEGKYKNVRYINNTRTRPGNPLNGEGSEVPVVNMLEYSSIKGKPFVARTVQAEQQNIINIIKGEIENGKTQ
jgi:hypothetical protein